MNGLRKLSLMAAMLVCTTLAAVAQKPNIHILATGGLLPEQALRLLKQIILPAGGYQHIAGSGSRSEQNSQCDRGTDCKNRFSGHE